MKVTIVTLVLAASALGGCAATSSVDKSELVDVMQTSRWDLAKDYSYSISRMTHVYTYTAEAGTYAGTSRDTKGQYLVGQPGSVIITVDGRSYGRRTGGIYLPNNLNAPALLFFFYVEKERGSSNPAVNQVVANNVLRSNAAPAQAGIAGGVSAAIAALAERHSGDAVIPDAQPMDTRLREAIKRSTQSPVSSSTALAMASPDPGKTISESRFVPESNVTVEFKKSMVVGKTMVYAHPRDEAQFGNVHLTVSELAVHAKNLRSSATGSWNIADGVLCAHFDSAGWQPICFALRSINGDELELQDTVHKRIIHARFQ